MSYIVHKTHFESIIYILFFVLFSYSIQVKSGDLNKAKTAISKKSPKSHSDVNNKYKYNHDHDSDTFAWNIFSGGFRLLTHTISTTGQISFAKVQTKLTNSKLNINGFNFTTRSIGDAQLPFLQVETGLHNPFGDTFSYNYSFLAGYGPFAYKYKQHSYYENSPKDDLNIIHSHGLIRLSIGDFIEIHQGLGTTSYTDSIGWKETSVSYTSPIFINFNKRFQFELSPIWANNTTEFDTSLNYTNPFHIYKLGFRVFETNNITLNGVYISVAFQY